MTAGQLYSFSYLSHNLKGDSELRKIITVTVADVPAQAGQPVMVSHSKTQIEVEWPDVADEQGMAGMISGYYLWMDNGFNENF